MDVTAYLRRIKYDGSLEITPEVLGDLHYAHLLSVPFENLDIHLGREIILDESRLVNKIVTERRGGFCYELNGAFAALLRELGFEVELLSARVFENGAYTPEFDHLVLRIRLEEDWLVDVGFGDSFLKPLRLRNREKLTQWGRTYRLESESSGRELLAKDDRDSWERFYRFTLRPHQLVEFNGRCWYNQTSPDSHFTQKRLCTRATPEGRITISDQRLIITERGQRNEIKLGKVGEYHAALDKHFGIRLPTP